MRRAGALPRGHFDVLLDGLRRLRRDGLPAVVGGLGATWITLLTTAA